MKKLLCKDCEAKIGQWEDYARNVLYGRTPGSDIRKRDIGESIADQLGPRDMTAKYFRDLRQTTVDYKSFKLFELSILWRAGIEERSWGKEVKLGPFQEELREHLLNDDPGPPLCLPAIIVDLRDQDVFFEGILASVELLRKKPSLYRFALGGYSWLFSVSKRIVHRGAPHFYLQEDGNLRIIVAEGRPIAEQFARLFSKT